MKFCQMTLSELLSPMLKDKKVLWGKLLTKEFDTIDTYSKTLPNYILKTKV